MNQGNNVAKTITIGLVLLIFGSLTIADKQNGKLVAAYDLKNI